MVDNTNKHFKGQIVDEEVLTFFRRHYVVIIPQILGILVLVFLFAVVFISDFKSVVNAVFPPPIYPFFAFTVIFVLTYMMHRIFTGLLNYFFGIVIVTNHRIIDLNKTVVLQDDCDAIDLTKIQDVRMIKDGIMKTILNYGDLVITMPAVNMIKAIHCVPNPGYYFRKINKTKRQYVLQHFHQYERVDAKPQIANVHVRQFHRVGHDIQPSSELPSPF
jgi:hypothetical protein